MSTKRVRFHISSGSSEESIAKSLVYSCREIKDFLYKVIGRLQGKRDLMMEIGNQILQAHPLDEDLVNTIKILLEEAEEFLVTYEYWFIPYFDHPDNGTFLPSDPEKELLFKGERLFNRRFWFRFVELYKTLVTKSVIELKEERKFCVESQGEHNINNSPRLRQALDLIDYGIRHLRNNVKSVKGQNVYIPNYNEFLEPKRRVEQLMVDFAFMNPMDA